MCRNDHFQYGHRRPESDMGGGSVSGEVDGILTVELFKEICEGVGPKGPE